MNIQDEHNKRDSQHDKWYRAKDRQTYSNDGKLVMDDEGQN